MLLWDMRWKGHEHRLRGLSGPQRRKLAMVSIDHCLRILGPQFIEDMPDPAQDAVRGAISVIQDPCEDFQHYLRLRDLTESQVNDDLPPGGHDFLMAMTTLLGSGQEDPDEKTVIESMSYLYQSVLDREILSRLQKPTRESEVNVMEEGNERCLECISSQLASLEAIAGGDAQTEKGTF